MKERVVNAGALFEMLRMAIEKNPNSGTYLVFDLKAGAVLVMSMSVELNFIIKHWFDQQILQGKAAGGMGPTPPDAVKDTECQ